MALDQNAGKKRTVSLARNLAPLIESTEDKSITVSEALKSVETPVVKETITTIIPTIATAPIATSVAVKTNATIHNRTRKISFLADPVLEARFKKARLKAGFEKLEDAYNQAMITFCELAEQGKLVNKDW